jgi:hypothetical protein
MGLFNSLFGKSARNDGPFKSEDDYARSRALNLKMTPETMVQLRKFGVTDESQLKLEYFFYTNTREKAAALAQKLATMGYAGDFDTAANNKKQFVINGWTPKMKMDKQTVLDCTTAMCDIGREHDCEFDGWGTNPKQP